MIDQLVADPGQKPLDRAQAARQHDVSMAALGHRLAVRADRGRSSRSTIVTCP